MKYDVLNSQKASLVILDVNSLYPEPMRTPFAPKTINIEENMKKRYTTLWEMKQRLKALVASIRQEKADHRQHTRAQYEFRHLHIARCLIKGRTIEQVEGAVDSHTRKGNKPDMSYVGKLVAEWQPKHEAEVAEMRREFELVPVLARAGG